MTDQTAVALTEFDFIAVIDTSGSMGEEDMPGNRSRYEYMQETATQFCRSLEKFDSDGIDVVLFGGSRIEKFQGVTSAKVKEVFATRSPSGGTPLAQALSAALECAGKSDKRDFIVVFTDGVPDDKKAAADVIRAASHKLEKDEDLTILFIQVGRDAAATAYLRSLDDDLKGAKFDIVDAKTMDEAEAYPTIADLIIAAIND